MIDVVWLKPESWDHIMLRDLFDGVLWKPVNGYEFNIISNMEDVKGEGAVVVVPGAYHEVEYINDCVASLEWVVIMIVSDENNIFPTDRLNHPNMKLWVQTPRVGRDYGEARFFGVGYAYARKYATSGDKSSDVFISGQNTHKRREEIFSQLSDYKDSRPDITTMIVKTRGFTQGLSKSEYYSYLEGCKVAPAPSGIISPDSFRAYEALEMACLPLLDDLSPNYESQGYWKMLFPDTPASVLNKSSIGNIIDTELSQFSWRQNQVFAWWIGQKRKYAYDLYDDLKQLGAQQYLEHDIKNRITVVIPVSPWKSHPDTSILETTIRSAQKQLPGAEIIVAFDGVREEQKDRFDDYQEFVRRMLWKINYEYDNVLPLFFKEHMHQSGMMSEVLKHIKTQSVLYLEGDSPLYEDKYIDWGYILLGVEQNHAIYRLYNKEEVPKEHEYLMYPQHSFKHDGVELIATRQWSQQPHICSVDTYRRILKHFSDRAKCFIEDKIYYVIANEGFDKWPMYIYKADSPRSYHLDGRAGEPKYDDKQIF